VALLLARTPVRAAIDGGVDAIPVIAGFACVEPSVPAGGGRRIAQARNADRKAVVRTPIGLSSDRASATSASSDVP